MRFRIGVHLGDVIEKADGTVYGDGVNIAARLEGLAEPGGITVSESIRAAVKTKAGAVFEDQGEQPVKNIAEPVRAYRLRRAGTVAPQAALCASAAPAVPAGEPALPLPDKPSIAVLPFTNMSGDVEQEYFADGIAEDIITELSRFQSIFVIARNSTFTFKGRSVDVQGVARQLGVHFVLEGSVRRAGQRVRITAQLIDGLTGNHVWAERYEDVLDDVFDLQERITAQIVGTLVPEIEREEMRLAERGARRFTEADDLAWRANKAIADAVFEGVPALALEAGRIAQTAIDRDRRCWLAWQALCSSHGHRVFFGWTDDRAGSLAVAAHAADTMLSLAPRESRSWVARGQVRHLAGDVERGLADLRRAHELNPSDSRATFGLASVEAAAGNFERARTLAAQALRISPQDRWVGVAHLAYALAAFIERDFDALRHWGELAIQSHPAAPIRRALMIACAAETGDAELLRTHRDYLRGVAPDFVPSLFRGDHRPYHHPEHMAMLLASLRKAGLP